MDRFKADLSPQQMITTWHPGGGRIMSNSLKAGKNELSSGPSTSFLHSTYPNKMKPSDLGIIMQVANGLRRESTPALRGYSPLLLRNRGVPSLHQKIEGIKTHRLVERSDQDDSKQVNKSTHKEQTTSSEAAGSTDITELPRGVAPKEPQKTESLSQELVIVLPKDGIACQRSPTDSRRQSHPVYTKSSLINRSNTTSNTSLSGSSSGGTLFYPRPGTGSAVSPLPSVVQQGRSSSTTTRRVSFSEVVDVSSGEKFPLKSVPVAFSFSRNQIPGLHMSAKKTSVFATMRGLPIAESS
jgi:hypothetical protein